MAVSIYGINQYCTASHGGEHAAMAGRIDWHAMTNGFAGAPDYGSAHRRLRKAWDVKVKTGQVVCYRCNKLIRPWDEWQLGHNDWQPGSYAGPEHKACNEAAGGRKGNARRWSKAHTPDTRQPNSRRW